MQLAPYTVYPSPFGPEYVPPSKKNKKFFDFLIGKVYAVLLHQLKTEAKGRATCHCALILSRTWNGSIAL